jgi:hypothetical protein
MRMRQKLHPIAIAAAAALAATNVFFRLVF